jgi:small conductance mechanosensitive channel
VKPSRSITLLASIVEGDRILLQDGTTGTVQKLGWLNTHLRQSDELVVRIPNTQISGKRVANISRSRLSTVKQALAVPYDDIDKLPKLMGDIKAEIRKSCPTLVDDGSRGFTVFFTEYKDTSVTVSVSAYFRTRPFSEEYLVVKQDVMMAIRRATEKNNVKFSYVNWSQSGIPID